MYFTKIGMTMATIYIVLHIAWFSLGLLDRDLGEHSDKMYDGSLGVMDKADEEVKRLERERAEKAYQLYLDQRDREIKIVKSRDNSQKVVANRGGGRSSMKSYMDYRKITSKSSDQYKLQQNPDVYTDSEGFRRLGEHYIIAVGTYYSETISDVLEVELSTGRVFTAIVGDIKDNKHTDSENKQHIKDGSVVEFLVDTKKMDKTCKKMGNMSYAPIADMAGDVVNISKINQ